MDKTVPQKVFFIHRDCIFIAIRMNKSSQATHTFPAAIPSPSKSNAPINRLLISGSRALKFYDYHSCLVKWRHICPWRPIYALVAIVTVNYLSRLSRLFYLNLNVLIVSVPAVYSLLLWFIHTDRNPTDIGLTFSSCYPVIWNGYVLSSPPWHLWKEIGVTFSLTSPSTWHPNIWKEQGQWKYHIGTMQNCSTSVWTLLHSIQ